MRRLPIKLLIIAGLLASGLIPTLVVSVVSYNTTRAEMTDQVFRQLESIRNLKREQIGSFFAERFADIAAFAASPTALDAYKELEGAFFHDGGSAGGRFKGLSAGKFTAPESYAVVHDRYISYFENLVSLYKYYDLFLLDAGAGDVLFSVRKEADFGARASAIASSLHDVWSIAVRQRRIGVSDTRPYPPSGNAPAQFVAAPLVEGGGVVGVIALQISIDSIDEIIKERSGMWRTGETYLVGRDLKMRSDSYLDKLGHSVEASFKGTVADNGADTVAAREALEGAEGEKIVVDYRGKRALSAYTPIRIKDFQWALIAEVDEEEINDQIASALNSKLTFLIGISVLLLLLLALTISALLNRGIRSVVSQMEDLIDEILRGNLGARGRPNSVGVDFQGVMTRTNELLDAFDRQTAEKRKLEEHLQRAQRLEAIGALAGGIAHDFNNILTAMHAHAQIIKASIPGNGVAAEHAAELVAAIRRASRLIEQILTFSRRTKTAERVIDVSREVRVSIRLLKATLPLGMRVDTRLSPRGVFVRADPAQIHQVVTNLCTNACRAMRSGEGTLTIAIEEVELSSNHTLKLREGRYCRISVEDTGAGMDEETRQRIFEPFFTTKPDGEGSGMGLSVVHGIVSKHGGAIEVDSAPGEGSRFDVYLPVEESDEAREVKEEDEAPLTPGQGHILFVDRDPQVRESNKRALEHLGYSVTALEQCPEAERELSCNPGRFDLLVLNLDRPYEKGLELIGRIGACRPRLPVILTTGGADVADIRDVDRLSPCRVLRKPYGLNDLTSLMARLLKTGGGDGP